MPCKPLSCVCGNVALPQRYIITLFGFLSLTVVYYLRQSFNVVLKEMLIKNKHTIHSVCYGTVQMEVFRTTYNVTRLMTWNESEQCMAKTSFYFGYIFGHLFAVFFVDTYGGKPFIAASLILSIIFNIITPILAEYGGLKPVIFCRVCIGLGQGLHFPAVSAVIAEWIPLYERTFLGVFVMTGIPMGSLLASSITPQVSKLFNDWTTSYYVESFIAFLFLLVFLIFFYSFPENDPFITEEERSYLSKLMLPKSKAPIPFTAIFTDITVWAQIVGHFGHCWSWYIMSNGMPKYFINVFGLNLDDLGYLFTLTNICQVLGSLIWALFVSFAHYNEWMTLLALRKLSTSLGSILPALFLFGVGYSYCSLLLTMLSMCLMAFFKGFYYSGIDCNFWDITRNYAGSITAIVNGMGSISGTTVLYFNEFLTKNQKNSDWILAFWISNGITIAATTFYLIFAKCNMALWDSNRRHLTIETGIQRKYAKQINRNARTHKRT